MGKALTNDVEDELQKLLIVDKLRRRDGWYETRESLLFFSVHHETAELGRLGGTHLSRSIERRSSRSLVTASAVGTTVSRRLAVLEAGERRLCDRAQGSPSRCSSEQN